MTRKKKKTYAAILVVGMAALIVDRLMPGGGATTPETADASVPAIALALEGSSDASAGSANLIPSIPFPRQLPPAPLDRPIRDAFARPTVAGLKEVDATTASGDGERPLTASEFAAFHRLSAVMNEDDLQIAILDGRWMRLGDRVNGCRLDKLDGIRAVFTCESGEKAVLEVAGAGNHSPAKATQSGHR